MKKKETTNPLEVRSLEIKLWDQKVGYIAEINGHIEFEYEEDFKSHKLEISPFELPLDTTTIYSSPQKGITFKGLPGVFADALPDTYGQTVINNYFLNQHGIPPNKVTPLMGLAYLSNRGMGALEFSPSITHKTKTSREEITLPELVVAVKKTITGKADKAIAEIMKVGTSAGGIQAKAAIDYNPSTNEVRMGLSEVGKGFIPSILKFDGLRDGDFTGYYGKNEYIYNLIANECGIKVSPFFLIEGQPQDHSDLKPFHFLSTRFDRDEKRNKPYHMSTYCALSLFDFRKYNSSSYENLLRITKSLCITDVSQVEEVFKRSVFNVILKNEDDHTKNFSFLMDKSGKWMASPAYDLNYVHSRYGHQMSINGKNDNIKREDLLHLAKSIDIKNKKALSIIDEVMTAAKKYLQYANQVNLAEDFAEGIFKNFNFRI
jgi:serine/threonine-protein kinase HipA